MVIIAIAGACLGVGAGFINSLISRKALNSDTITSLFAINAVRFAIDAACLVIIFFVCRWTGKPVLIPLLITALGLTLGGMFFLIKQTRNNTPGPGTEKEERKRADD